MTRRPKQTTFAHVAEALEADVEDLFPSDPQEAGERVGLLAIIGAMRMEAARVGESTRSLSGGCHIRYRIQDDRRMLVAWRDETTRPSDTELATLHRDFGVPDGVMWTWEQRKGIDLAVSRWDVGVHPSGQVYEDLRTVAEAQRYVEQSDFKAAWAACWRIHGRVEQLAMMREIQAAEDAAKDSI